VSIPFWHVGVESAYRRGVAASARHPDVHHFLADVLPVNHVNVTEVLWSPSAHPLPAGHPAIDPWIGNLSRPSYTPYRASLRFWHPQVEAAYRGGQAAPAAHPAVHALLADVMPAAHTNLSALIANPSAHPLPADHPAIDPWLEYLAQPAYAPFRYCFLALSYASDPRDANA
jgi:hypothetical protein